MLGRSKYLTRCSTSAIVFNKKPLVRYFKGGVPGCNLPFRKSIDNPVRFTILYTLAGIVGFGAPWLVIMHQMLRPYDYVVD